MTRPAKFTDVATIAELLFELYGRSAYAPFGVWNQKEAKALIVQCIQRHGGQRYGSTFAQVAERDGQICGFILGMLDRSYQILDCLTATDLFFYCRPGAPVHAAPTLLREFVEWARKSPALMDIRVAVTDAGGTEPDRTDALYRHVGLSRCGAVYEWRRLTKVST